MGRKSKLKLARRMARSQAAGARLHDSEFGETQYTTMRNGRIVVSGGERLLYKRVKKGF